MANDPGEANKYTTMAVQLVTAMKNIFLKKSDKVTSWSATTSNDKVPSEKLVKDSLDAKANANSIPSKISDLTDDSSFIDATELSSELSGYIAKSNTNGLVKNDGTIDTSTYLTTHQNISGKEDKINKVTAWSSTPTNDHYPSEALVKNSLDAKANTTSIPTKVSQLTNDSGFLTEHQSLDSKTVTVEKITTQSGYSASYAIKQNGSQVGATINIPKDLLVQDAGMSEVSTANTPVNGYEVGDKYLWFKINADGENTNNKYIYVLVSDLIDTYNADNVTIELGNNNTFKVKDGSIGATQLSSAVNTSLGYANAWNSSPAKNITAADISQWNSAGNSNLSITDVDAEIEAYLSAITTELNK